MLGTRKEPYDEMRRHLPILWTVMKYLPGRDLLSARVIDPYWRDAITETLEERERVGNSPLNTINLRSRQNLQHFLAAFPPAQNPTNGFPLLQFGNLRLTLELIPEVNQILDMCGPHLKFFTIGIPYNIPSASASAYLKVLLNKCKVLEKLSLTFFDRNVDGWTLPQISESLVLEPLPTLKRIHFEHLPIHLDNLLGDLVKAAPNLRWTTATRWISNFQPNGIRAILKPLEHTVFVKLTLESRLEVNHQQFFQEVGDIDLKLLELSLRIDQDANDANDANDNRNGNLLSDWLTKLNKNCFQKLSLSAYGFQIHFPPILGIRCLRLSVYSRFDTPIEPSQVPNLEDLTLLQPFLLGNNNVSIPNIFAPGKVFGSVKKLQLEFPNEGREDQLRSNFPNLERIKIINHSRTENGSFALRNFLQFPNLVQLSIEFRGISMEEIGMWWDIVTGGMSPRMNRETTLDVMYTKTGPDADGNEFQTLFHHLPNLRILKLSQCPAGFIFAIIHLTGTDNMRRLHTLQLDPLRYGHRKIFKHFVPMLKRHHNSVVGFRNLELEIDSDSD